MFAGARPSGAGLKNWGTGMGSHPVSTGWDSPPIWAVQCVGREAPGLLPASEWDAKGPPDQCSEEVVP